MDGNQYREWVINYNLFSKIKVTLFANKSDGTRSKMKYLGY